MRFQNILACVPAAMMLLAGISANAQNAGGKKARQPKDDDVKVRIWLNKGEQRVLDGYLRSALVNRPDHIEFSTTPDGQRIRYINEDVDSLLLEGTDKYVKALSKSLVLSEEMRRFNGCARNITAKVLTCTLFSLSSPKGQAGTSRSCVRCADGT